MKFSIQQQQQITHLFQVHTEYFPRKAFIQGRKRSLNLEVLKLYDVCSHTKIELN